MSGDFTYELKIIGLIAMISLGLTVSSIEVRSASNQQAPDTMQVLHRSYSKMVAHVDGNLERLKREIDSTF